MLTSNIETTSVECYSNLNFWILMDALVSVNLGY